MQKRALENQKRAPENCYRLQCKSLFNVADLVNGMWKVAPPQKKKKNNNNNNNNNFGLLQAYQKHTQIVFSSLKWQMPINAKSNPYRLPWPKYKSWPLWGTTWLSEQFCHWSCHITNFHSFDRFHCTCTCTSRIKLRSKIIFHSCLR